jgi:hypothetical protein
MSENFRRRCGRFTVSRGLRSLSLRDRAATVRGWKSGNTNQGFQILLRDILIALILNSEKVILSSSPLILTSTNFPISPCGLSVGSWRFVQIDGQLERVPLFVWSRSRNFIISKYGFASCLSIHSRPSINPNSKALSWRNESMLRQYCRQDLRGNHSAVRSWELKDIVAFL